MTRFTVLAALMLLTWWTALPGCQKPPRMAAGAAGPADPIVVIATAEEARIMEMYRRLDQPIGPLEFDHATIEAVLKTWAEKSGFQLLIDWDDVRTGDFRKQTQITMSLPSMAADDALDLILWGSGADTSTRTWGFAGERVRIGTLSSLPKRAVVYDTRGFVAWWEADERAWRRHAEQEYPNALEPGMSAAGWMTAREKWERQILEAGPRIIHPETWVPTGPGDRNALNGFLTVNHAERCHREFALLLARMRKAMRAAASLPVPTTVFNVEDVRAAWKLSREDRQPKLDLDRRVDLSDLKRISVRQAMGALAGRFGVCMVVDWPGLASLGPAPDAIDLNASIATLPEALSALSRATWPTKGITWFQEGGIVRVFAVGRIDHPTTLRVYDIRDIRRLGWDYNCRRVQPLGAKAEIAAALKRGYCLTKEGEEEEEEEEEEECIVQRLRGSPVDEFIIRDMIKDIVAPESWEPTDFAHAEVLEHLLIVTQTGQAHYEIEQLLAKLRASCLAGEKAQKGVH